jgi:hypothetical protein
VHEGFCGAGFSLWVLVLARTKTHRLKPAPHALPPRGESDYKFSAQKSKTGVDQRRSSGLTDANSVARDASKACSIVSSERPFVSIPMKM